MDREKLLRNPLPINRVAARVMRKGEHWQPKGKNQPHHIISNTAPLPIREFDHSVPSELRALIGQRRGRMVVIGLAQKAGRWVVRCDCGNYEHRARVQAWLASEYDDGCSECSRRFYLLRGYSLQDDRKLPKEGRLAAESSGRLAPRCARDQARSATTEGRGPKDAEPGAR